MRIAGDELEVAVRLVEADLDRHLLARGMLDGIRDRLLDEAVDRRLLECPAPVEDCGGHRFEVAQLGGVASGRNETVDVGVDDRALVIAAQHGQHLPEFDAGATGGIGDEAGAFANFVRGEVLPHGQGAGIHGDDRQVVGQRIVHIAGDAAAHFGDGAVLP